MTAPARFPGDHSDLVDRIDRHGRSHQERRPKPRGAEPPMHRVPGELERAWEVPQHRARLRSEVLAHANPMIAADADEPAQSLWTWTVIAADARAVVLWTNPVFDHADVSTAELARLEDSDLWTITLRLPSAMRLAYRIGTWTGDDAPPWRAAQGRRPVLLAAMDASVPDPRCDDSVHGSRGAISSVAAGPDAPRDPRRTLPQASRRGRVDTLHLPHDERAWIYAPAGTQPETPLLVLFDGEVWERELPDLLDSAIESGILPPVHVAMLDAQDTQRRWDHLGIPGGQVDAVIDDLLPRVRRGWNVRASGADTVVSGQSLGGIAALWTVALAGGEVSHAIAQSPSLWRFDIAETLLEAPDWASIELQAGSYEGDMLADAAALSTRLEADPRLADRRVALSPFEAGHDWAVWRANLFRSLAAHPWRDQAAVSSSGAV